MGLASEFVHNMSWGSLLELLLQMAAILICLTIHEVSHGFAAYCLGDPTAKTQHRLSLNPLHHIDPIGALMMLVAGFGWAKPVPVDMRYFKHPKSGMAITALAGPLSNFVLAFVALFLALLLYPVVPVSVQSFLLQMASLSLGLGIFNLIPFPPLDGSKMLGALLPNRIYYTILRYERIGMFLLMAVLWLGLLDGPLVAARVWVFKQFLHGANWLIMLF